MVLEIIIDSIASRVVKHNGMIERQYVIEKKVTMLKGDVEQIRRAG